MSRDDAPSLRLPANARNINYCVRSPASYYDFDTTEAGFAEFAGNWRLPWNKTEGQGYASTWNHATNSLDDVRIGDGIYFGWSKDDANWWLAYDRKTGRAYCSGTYR